MVAWSGIHRLLIWRFGADRIAERPLLGWGMDASRAIPGGKTKFNDLLPTLHYPGDAEAMPLHPHDAALQWQLELGIPGLLLGLTLVVWVIYRIGWRRDRPIGERAAALALAAAALVVGLLSFGIWQAWWLSTLWLTASLFAAGSGDGQDRGRQAEPTALERAAAGTEREIRIVHQRRHIADIDMQ
jgi:O-antigen ligase